MVLRDIYIISTIIIVKIFTISCKEKGSLTFVIDDTSSMRNEINQVEDAVNNITNFFLEGESSQIENFVLVTFNDPGFQLRTKTSNPSTLKQSLKSIWVGGGGDCPEMVLSGVKLALQESLPHSYLYVFTDAYPKDYKLAEEVITLAQERGSQVVFIITPDRYCDKMPSSFHARVYNTIAAATFGQVFNLTHKGEVEKIMGTVVETSKGDRSVITSVVVPADEWTTVPFVIDDQTEYAIISASGRKVKLYISEGPTTSFKKITWIENAKVVKLPNPSPGAYKAMVFGSSITTVMVLGRTDFSFQHGFSKHNSTSLKNVEKQPTDGYEYHLIISVNDPKHSVDISSVVLLDMKEKLILELPLKWISGDIYTTELFLPPQHKTSTFLIAVVGQTKSHKTIRRISRTPIETLL